MPHAALHIDLSICVFVLQNLFRNTLSSSLSLDPSWLWFCSPRSSSTGKNLLFPKWFLCTTWSCFSKAHLKLFPWLSNHLPLCLWNCKFSEVMILTNLQAILMTAGARHGWSLKAYPLWTANVMDTSADYRIHCTGPEMEWVQFLSNLLHRYSAIYLVNAK